MDIDIKRKVEVLQLPSHFYDERFQFEIVINNTIQYDLDFTIVFITKSACFKNKLTEGWFKRLRLNYSACGLRRCVCQISLSKQ